MSSLGDWVKLLTAVTAVLGAIAAVIRVLVKRFPPRAASLADDVNRLRGEVSSLRDETGVQRSDMRKLTDYVHDLREHIAEGKPPPPPDWPEGLRL